MAESARPVDPAGLTGEQLQVLGLVVDGFSNEEICLATGLTIASVKECVRTAQALSGLTSRHPAAEWAVGGARRAGPTGGS